MKKRIKKFLKNRCVHDFDMYMKIKDSKLTEPGGTPREVKIRIVYVSCTRCERIFKVTPLGVVHDPVKNIFMEEDTVIEDHAVLNEADQKRLKKELKEEGIKV